VTSTVTAEYVVIGSGAGGGPLAARLAEAGYSVIVLEAGEQVDGLVYEVPAFHAYASEAPEMAWNFFVRHYDEDAQQKRDPKFDATGDGVLYPRCATIGGCTAHNAMITVYPNDSDWDAIAHLTGDPSWRADAMRGHFQQLERCTYRRYWRLPKARLLARLVQAVPGLRELFDADGHGFDGWLPTSIAKPSLLAHDRQLIKVVVAAAEEELASMLGRPLNAWERLSDWFDPNDADTQAKGLLGLWLIPLAVGAGRRYGSRERLRQAEARPGGSLRILSGCLATRLVLDEHNRCTGVEYLPAPHVYRADPNAVAPGWVRHRNVVATREVIVAAGAFNTPQLLKLSGIGPADELREHGIDVRVDLPGVGANLQDRYEITVVTEMAADFELITAGAFRPPRFGDPPDPLLAQWRAGKGAYTTNGGLLAITAKSSPDQPVPDLFLFALPANFRGYYPHYAEDLEHRPNRLSWAILKAHTNNRAGSVRLRSADPLDTPDIRFRYFGEGSDTAGDDLDAVLAGVKLARRLTGRLADWGAHEIYPGPDIDTDAEIRRFIADNAWGHHACGSCAIGPDGDPGAVLDSSFGVRGVAGLRVVDASVFPRIPGYFIASAVYMISEKAADVILADAATVPAQL
jgi:choline dehydrogenase